MGYGRVRHASALGPEPDCPRVVEGEGRRADARDPASHRPVSPGRRGPRGRRPENGLDRLRRHQADGGTRTASISGAYVALAEAFRRLLKEGRIERDPLADRLAAVSVGIVDGKPVLDLTYAEDSTAEVDMNVVMTGRGRFVEVQGTAEGAPFGERDLASLLALARRGFDSFSRFRSARWAGKNREPGDRRVVSPRPRHKGVDFGHPVMYLYNPFRKSGAWRSPVARLLWEQDVGGSNPLAPTMPPGHALGIREWRRHEDRSSRGTPDSETLGRLLRPPGHIVGRP